ncbi:MAG TPA: class I adenylate-forming enzyme family protein [Candidatus Hydrogenedentes bacterium]|nr:class I adenylate-forming enzyme family protein [Candidatus Hydrogenedentota bacterium]
MTADDSIGSIRLIGEAVSRWAALYPEREAVVDGSIRLSWRQLDESVRRLAAVMRKAGVGPGDCVAQIAPPCAAFPIAWLAAARIGAFWGGFSPRYASDELRAMLEDCAPAVLIADLSAPCGLDPDTYDALSDVSENLLLRLTLGAGGQSDDPDFWETIEREADGIPTDAGNPDAEDPEAPALLLYTSGSTGRPLGVLHSHRSILASASREAARFGIDSSARFLLHFPINHVAADIEIGYCVLLAGGTLVIRPKFSAADVMETIQAENVTALGQIPAMYAMLFADPAYDPERFRGARKLIYGGDIMSQGLLDNLAALARRIGADILTGYGLSEFAGFVSASQPGDTHYPGFAGRPHPDCEIRVVDESGHPLRDGEAGEILLRGPSRMLGYLNQPGITRARIDAEGWFHTGDMGLLRKGILEIRGRRSGMFKSGGENVFPSEIELVLEAHPAVLAAAVMAVPDPVYGEVAHAFVVPVPGTGLSEEGLRSYCAARLTHFKIPRRFDFRDRLPLLSSGKVDRVALKALVSRFSGEPAP